LAQLGLGVGQHLGVALGLGQLNQPDGVVELAGQRLVAADGVIQVGALAQQGLRLLRAVPELGILGEGVQLVQSSECVVPVKETSSAARATA
jgi:hypothetical protein